MPAFQPPEKFSFDQPAAWPQWKRHFERYRTVSKLAAEEEEIQVSTPINAMGIEAGDIFYSFSLSAADNKKYATVMNKFDEHFVPKCNVIHERSVFSKRYQQPNESVEAYVRSLYELSKYCEFTGQKDDFIRDKFVIGLRDTELCEKLQLTKDLTLQTAIDMARHHDLIKSQTAAQGSVAAVRRDARAHSPRKQHPPPRFNRALAALQSTSTGQRGNCGYDAVRSHKDGKCPAEPGDSEAQQTCLYRAGEDKEPYSVPCPRRVAIPLMP